MYTATYYNYAVLLSTIRKFDELKELLDTALGIPGIIKATIYNEYGIMYEQLGEFEKAIEYYRKCALDTLDQNVVDRAKQSITRCNSKKGSLKYSPTCSSPNEEGKSKEHANRYYHSITRTSGKSF